LEHLLAFLGGSSGQVVDKPSCLCIPSLQHSLSVSSFCQQKLQRKACFSKNVQTLYTAALTSNYPKNVPSIVSASQSDASCSAKLVAAITGAVC